MRPIESWLPPIDNLCQIIEKAVMMIQNTHIDLNKGNNQIFNSNSSMITFDEAIALRKKELKYLKQLLSNCQNSMHAKLAESQLELTKKMKSIDLEIQKFEQLITNGFSNHPSSNSNIQPIENQINEYKGKISLISSQIQKSQKKLHHNHKIHKQLRIDLNLIRHLKHKKSKLSKTVKNPKSEDLLAPEAENQANSANQKTKKLLKNSISALKSNISMIDNDNLEVKTQINQVKSLIHLNHEQLVNIKKVTNETVSKTTQKALFITNVVDEMKNLIQIRTNRTEINEKISKEKTKFDQLKEEIQSIQMLIKRIKAKKQKVQNEFYEIEENFLYETLPQREHIKKFPSRRNIVKTHFLSDDYNDHSLDSNEDEAARIENQRIIQEKRQINAKLFKSLERKNARISEMRHAIRQLQEEMTYKAKIKKERDEAKKNRIEHSVFFSFEKLLGQIKEKEENIQILKEKIREKKEFLKEYSQYEEMINQFDDPYSRYS